MSEQNTRVKKRFFNYTIVQTLFFILITFLMMLAFWDKKAFGSDEVEIFIKGQEVAQGRLLYTEVASQHMPLMYYIAAFFARFGVHTIAGFRACFYFLFAVLWGLIYLYYSHYINRKAIFLYPVIYCIQIAGVSLATTILSDQLQGIGMAILFYALIKFYHDRQMKILDCLYISLAIFISFGSAFVSLFAIFIMACLVLSLEIRDGVKARRNAGREFIYILKKYLKMFAIILAPFILLIAYYVHTGTLYEVYRWVYKFGVEVYPKYNTAYGNRILGAMLNGFTALGSSINFSSFSLSLVTIYVSILLVILYFVTAYRKTHDKMMTTGVVLFLICCATRGTFNYHGLAFLAVDSAICGLYLVSVKDQIKAFASKSILRKAICILIGLALTANYMMAFPHLFNFTTKEYINKNSTEYAINVLTDKNERIGYSLIDYSIAIKAGVTPSMVYGGACPWFWEWLSDQAMAELRSDPPRVFAYDPNQETWGYKITEYAPEIGGYLKQHYTSLSSLGYAQVYVRNDYYEEAVEKLSGIASGNFDSSGGVLDEIVAGDVIEQSFQPSQTETVTAVYLLLGTYGRSNHCALTITLIDQTTGEETVLGTIDGDEALDNSYNAIGFEPYQLDSGSTYTIRITSEDASNGDAMTIYRSETDADPDDENYAIVNGQEQEFNLVYQIRTEDEEDHVMVVENKDY